ncbi:hypothetical protein HDU97_005973 [Phlyctochytrium planicorne]|nr:hypothetical protein HDU97_005973 [Phlyctochytrium planicorne]
MAYAIGSKGSLANPERFGFIPLEMRPYRTILPSFLHGKEIGTGEYLTEKGGNRIRKIVYPNFIYKFVYSRLLDMNIYCRLTTTTLRQIERRGGFDEYLLSIGEGRCDNEHALMYKRMVEKAFEESKEQIRAEELRLAEKHGQEYVK